MSSRQIWRRARCYFRKWMGTWALSHHGPRFGSRLDPGRYRAKHFSRKSSLQNNMQDTVLAVPIVGKKAPWRVLRLDAFKVIFQCMDAFVFVPCVFYLNFHIIGAYGEQDVVQLWSIWISTSFFLLLNSYGESHWKYRNRVPLTFVKPEHIGCSS